MELSAPVLAFGKLVLTFALLVALLRFKVRLWLTIFLAAAALALSSGILPPAWPQIILEVLTRQDFIVLCLMIWLIILLSGVQEATGQSRDLVRGLEHYVASPRLRLVLFPALIGLLPMPGGALFSCPMIKAAAKDMALGDEKKTLINYWFRHIWETAWPLYPGYALACSLLGVSMTVLCRYTFPLVFLSFCAGWFCYMRDLARSPLLQQSTVCPANPEGAGQDSLAAVLLNGLPIAVTLVGAGLFGFLLDRFFPEAPGQIAFSLSLALAVGTALYQGRGRRDKALRALAFSANVGRIMLLLAAIFIFKELIAISGMVRDISVFGSGSSMMVVLACILVPFVSGLLTGILVGLVGISLPIVIGLVEHSPLKEYMLPLAVLALVAGNCGQLLSPLHVCLVVTCEFFTTRLPGIWRALLLPVACIMLGGALWAGVLALFNTHF